MSPTGSPRPTFTWHFVEPFFFLWEKKKKKKNHLPVFKKQSFALKSKFLASLEKKSVSLTMPGSRFWVAADGWS